MTLKNTFGRFRSAFSRTPKTRRRCASRRSRLRPRVETLESRLMMACDVGVVDGAFIDGDAGDNQVPVVQTDSGTQVTCRDAEGVSRHIVPGFSSRIEANVAGAGEPSKIVVTGGVEVIARGQKIAESGSFTPAGGITRRQANVVGAGEPLKIVVTGGIEVIARSQQIAEYDALKSVVELPEPDTGSAFTPADGVTRRQDKVLGAGEPSKIVVTSGIEVIARDLKTGEADAFSSVIDPPEPEAGVVFIPAGGVTRRLDTVVGAGEYSEVVMTGGVEVVARDRSIGEAASSIVKTGGTEVVARDLKISEPGSFESLLAEKDGMKRRLTGV